MGTGFAAFVLGCDGVGKTGMDGIAERDFHVVRYRVHPVSRGNDEAIVGSEQGDSNHSGNRDCFYSGGSF